MLDAPKLRLQACEVARSTAVAREAHGDKGDEDLLGSQTWQRDVRWGGVEG